MILWAKKRVLKISNLAPRLLFALEREIDNAGLLMSLALRIAFNRLFLLSTECSMQLTPREIEKLMVYTLADVALKRKSRGIKLNYPEAVAIITTAALEGAREGKTLEEVMNDTRQVLSRDDVMEGVADLIPHVQVEAIFTDGSRLVTVHDPIQ
jgi:urease subunit gamma